MTMAWVAIWFAATGGIVLPNSIGVSSSSLQIAEWTFPGQPETWDFARDGETDLMDTMALECLVHERVNGSERVESAATWPDAALLAACAAFLPGRGDAPSPEARPPLGSRGFQLFGDTEGGMLAAVTAAIIWFLGVRMTELALAGVLLGRSVGCAASSTLEASEADRLLEMSEWAEGGPGADAEVASEADWPSEMSEWTEGGPGAGAEEAVAEPDPWACWRPGHSQEAESDPWARWRPGALPVVPENQVLGQDPEDPEFEWVELEDEEPRAVACSNGWDPTELMYFVFEYGPSEGEGHVLRCPFRTLHISLQQRLCLQFLLLPHFIFLLLLLQVLVPREDLDPLETIERSNSGRHPRRLQQFQADRRLLRDVVLQRRGEHLFPGLQGDILIERSKNIFHADCLLDIAPSLPMFSSLQTVEMYSSKVAGTCIWLSEPSSEHGVGGGILF